MGQDSRFCLRMIERGDGTIEFQHPELNGAQAMALGMTLIKLKAEGSSAISIKTFLRTTIKFCSWIKHEKPNTVAECMKELERRFYVETSPSEVVDAAWWRGILNDLVQGGAK